MAMSPQEFARGAVRNRGGTPCLTCYKQEWRDAVRAVLKVWADPEERRAQEESGSTTEPSLGSLWEYLREHRGYTLTKSPLIRHIQNHEAELWRQIKTLYKIGS